MLKACQIPMELGFGPKLKSIIILAYCELKKTGHAMGSDKYRQSGCPDTSRHRQEVSFRNTAGKDPHYL